MLQFRRKLVAFSVIVAASLAGCARSPAVSAMEGAPMGAQGGLDVPRTGGPMAPEPDYSAVTAREFREAEAEGSPEALLRFIARHPEHPLADEARSRVYSDRGNPLFGSGTFGRTDPDADIYTAFYRAVRQDKAEAYEAFIRRFRPHPLVQEAQSLRKSLDRAPR